ncbi:hypothetical protein [Nocardia wallacei]|uniref:hypothetical protein n=1 Tax=Nocardia wallacei TaxID=480035 RepID=UPI0024543030|nr:hypothetical protein [Nocardia wallacei]
MRYEIEPTVVTLVRRRLESDYRLVYAYDPYIDGVFKKAVPSSERRRDLDERRWYVAAAAVDRLAFALRALGCEVVIEQEADRIPDH